MLVNPAARPPENKFADMSLVIEALEMANPRNAIAVGTKLLQNISVATNTENEKQTKSTFKSLNIFLRWAQKLKHAENKNPAFNEQANQIIQSVVDIINGSTVTGNNKTDSYRALNLILEAVEADKLKAETTDKLMSLKLPNAQEMRTQKGLSKAIENLGKLVIPLDGRDSADFITRFVLLGETDLPARSLQKTLSQQHMGSKKFLASPQKEVFREIVSGSEEEFRKFTEKYFRDRPTEETNEHQVLSDIKLGKFIDQENISQAKKDLFFDTLLIQHHKNTNTKLALREVFPQRQNLIPMNTENMIDSFLSILTGKL